MEGLSAKFQITLGGHYVYAIVNCPTEVTFVKDDNIHRVIGKAAAEATLGYQNGSFMMVNKCNSSTEDSRVFTVVTESHSVNNPAQMNNEQ